MEYTKNYHLPQWEETDRIMRTDFNQMCADMEDGLVGNRAECARVEESAFTRLVRTAYNHYCLLEKADPVPRQIGAFYQHSEKLSGVSTWKGVAFLSKPEQTMTSADFFASWTIVSEMTMVRGSVGTPAIAAFSTTAPGYISFLTIYIHCTGGSASTTPFMLELKNVDSGEVEWSKRIELDLSSATGGYPYTILDLNAWFHGGRNYQMIFRLVSPAADGTATFMPQRVNNSAHFPSGMPSCTITQKLQDVEESTGGMVVVRYREAADGGTFALTWNGEEMEPALIREIFYNENEIVQEVIYLRRDPLPAENEFSLNLAANLNGELYFYDWGAILF